MLGHDLPFPPIKTTVAHSAAHAQQQTAGTIGKVNWKLFWKQIDKAHRIQGIGNAYQAAIQAHPTRADPARQTSFPGSSPRRVPVSLEASSHNWITK